MLSADLTKVVSLFIFYCAIVFIYMVVTACDALNCPVGTCEL